MALYSSSNDTYLPGLDVIVCHLFSLGGGLEGQHSQSLPHHAVILGFVGVLMCLWSLGTPGVIKKFRHRKPLRHPHEFCSSWDPRAWSAKRTNSKCMNSLMSMDPFSRRSHGMEVQRRWRVTLRACWFGSCVNFSTVPRYPLLHSYHSDRT